MKFSHLVILLLSTHVVSASSDLAVNDPLSSVLNHSYFFGFIGENYRRLEVKFTSATPSIKNPKIIIVQGKSRVRDNVCDFLGEIQINKIETYPLPDKNSEQDCAIRNWKDVVEYGSFFGHYILKKNKNQKFSGTFEGDAKVNFHRFKDGKVSDGNPLYDCADLNNPQSYQGVWTQYGGKLTKKANWGTYRIPDSGDLDLGAGEFSANPKYFDQGWKAFYPFSNNYDF